MYGITMGRSSEREDVLMRRLAAIGLVVVLVVSLGASVSASFAGRKGDLSIGWFVIKDMPTLQAGGRLFLDVSDKIGLEGAYRYSGKLGSTCDFSLAYYVEKTKSSFLAVSAGMTTEYLRGGMKSAAMVYLQGGNYLGDVLFIESKIGFARRTTSWNMNVGIDIDENVFAQVSFAPSSPTMTVGVGLKF
jgi:hypothetical protein